MRTRRSPRPALRSRLARAALVAVFAVLVAGCGPVASPSPAPTPSPVVAPTDAPTPEPTFAPSPTATAEPSPEPATASPTASPAPTPTLAPSPTPRPTATPAAGPTVDAFWSRVERGIRAAGRMEVEIAGPNAGALRFEPDASATVIDGVVGFVCVGGRAYDGQSSFTRLPGRWTCGAPALTAGFRSIGQPIDAWNATIPTDNARRETLAVEDGRWTWRYRANSPFYGGAVTASVTLDPATGRIVAARRVDPTGTTRYTFDYGAEFPPIAVPR